MLFEIDQWQVFKNSMESQKKKKLQAPTDRLLGTILGGKFKIISKIGSGGVGRVYKALDESLDSEVAIKVMANFDEKKQERFKREARATRSLDHPNILRIFEYGMDRNYAFIVMELLEGASLSNMIGHHNPIQLKRCIDIMRQTALALGHAHGKGIVHRDVKPSNLLLIQTEDGKDQIKVVDFGIVKLLGAAAEGQVELSASDEIFGTPLYMSPEQINKDPLDNRSDIYSLGCVFYECLTGIPPLSGTSSIETVIKHLQDDPVPLREAGLSDFPEELETLVSKMLQKEPDDRIQSMEEFIEELDALGDLERFEKPVAIARKKVTDEIATLNILDKARLIEEQGDTVLSSEFSVPKDADEEKQELEETDTKTSKNKLVLQVSVIIFIVLSVLAGVFMLAK